MNRVFNSEKKTDILINEYTKITGVKIGKLFNNAVISWFLPVNTTSALFVEASFILEMQANDQLDQWTIKQSISRGISWLAKYPIENCELLNSILLHYTCNPWGKKKEDLTNDHVKDMFNEMQEKIKEKEPDYTPVHVCWGNFGVDITDRWETLWREKLAYNVLSAIVFVEEPQKPFTWYEAISILRDFETLANDKYGVK